MKLNTHQKVSRVGLSMLALAYFGTVVTIPFQQSASALSGSDFNAGHIIDNVIFTNQNAMTVQDIQNFLNSKVGSCDNNGTGSAAPFNSSMTRAQYDASIGKNTKFTCVNQYYENTTTLANNLDGNPIPTGAISAAQIIYNAAQQYQINPEVIIVTLQKEQALVTDTWPWDSEYKEAMGYACPDTAPCNSQYYGFYNQVTSAAWQFRQYLNNPNNYNYVIGTDKIYYNPSTSCGYSNVLIQSQATAALYNYTPYQPNSAALSNIDANGDNCSTYGNRNFWKYFNEWFGSPTLPSDVTDVNTSQRRIASVDYNGSLYVFYYDAFNQIIDVATRSDSGGSWTTAVLDGSNAQGGGRINASLGSSAEAVVYNNTLQLFYYDKTDGTLRHAWLSGTTWSFENLDGNSGAISGYTAAVGLNPTVLVSGSELDVFYYDKTNGNLRRAWSDAQGWHFENIDGDPGSLGHLNADMGLQSAAAVYNGSLQLYYYDSTHESLRHAWTDAQGWHFETLDGLANSNSHFASGVGMNPTLTIYNGSLQLYYYDSTHESLRHAWTDAQGWHFETLDGGSNSVSRSGFHTGIDPQVTTYGNTLQLYYYDALNTNLRHAWSDAQGWHFENLDGDAGSVLGNNGDVGINSSVLPGSNELDIFYYNTGSGNLEHAWSDTNGWHSETVDKSIVY